MKYLRDVTIVYRDDTREPTEYKDVTQVWRDEDIVWILLFKAGGGVQIAFSEVLHVEQSAKTGEIEGEESLCLTN